MVSGISARPCSQVSMIVVDIGGDMFTILNLVATDNPKFAAAMTVIFVSSMTKEFMEGMNPIDEVYETLARGRYSEKLLTFFRHEGGYEAFFSTAVTLYAFPYSTTTVFAFFASIGSILSAVYTISERVYQELDLLDFDVDTAGDGYARVLVAASAEREHGFE